MNLFPFKTIRPVQKEFLEKLRESIKKEKILIAHAPTGVGKTAAALSASIEDSLENDLKVLFLTPRHSQHEIAIETVKKIQQTHGVELSLIDLIGKKWLCNQEVSMMHNLDFQEYCKDLRKDERCVFYNKTFKGGELTEEALEAIEKIKKRVMHAEEVKMLCESLCPYYTALEAAKSANLYIADYFHIFSPEVRKSLCARTNLNLKKTILVVDEAHNLPDRIREISSSKITNLQLERAIKEAKYFGYYDIAEKISEIYKILKSIVSKKLKKTHENFVEKEELEDELSKNFEIESFLEELQILISAAIEKRKRSYCNSLKKFLILWSEEKEGFARLVRKEVFNNKLIQEMIIMCLDPSINSADIFREIKAGVLMSGTLTPTEMYADLLGIKERAISVVYPSPFPRKNRLNLIYGETTTKYTKRTALNFKKIALVLSKCISKVKGNSAVFFPSYELLEKISKQLNLDKKIFEEKRNLTKIERKIILDEFRKSKNSVLLGVISGSFDQGIDYPNNVLSAVFIVGIPLEKPDLKTKAMIDFYDFKFGRGWSYGYIFPAINKAVQAAGRCIRSENDLGVCVFIDERYTWENYRKAFPPDLILLQSKKPWLDVERFFKLKF